VRDRISSPLHVAWKVIGSLGAQASRALRAVAGFRAGVRAGQYGLLLKLLWRLADNCYVQRSALITGLSLAFCGLTLAGIGEWASGGFDSSSADNRSSTASAATMAGPSGTALTASLPSMPGPGSHLPADIPGYTLRRSVPEVRLQFTVSDQQGRLVTDLSPDDVRVFDNQRPVGHFSAFERDQDLPLHLGLVVDTSDSVKRVLADEKTAAAGFLQRVLRPQTDTAFVMGFGGDMKMWQQSTPDRQELLDAIQRLKQPGWGTRLFDALYTACANQLSGTDDAGPVHRAIIVLTDGDDTESFRSLADVIAAAQRNEIQVYALTIRSRKGADGGDGVLQRLADATGGRQYLARSGKDLDAAFTQIERDLRTQYYVSFPPQQSSPGFHALRIEVRPQQKLDVHARQGYYAMSE
jgi:VWFA-related protein